MLGSVCLCGRFINGSSPAVHLLGARCRRAITPNGPAVLDDLITALSAALPLDFGAIYTETDFFLTCTLINSVSTRLYSKTIANGVEPLLGVTLKNASFWFTASILQTTERKENITK